MTTATYYKDTNGEVWMETIHNGLHYFRCMTSERHPQVCDSVPADMVADPNPFGLVEED